MEILSKYPMMPKSFFLKKVIKNIPVFVGLGTPLLNSMFRPILSYLKFDYKTKFVSMVRGF